jgi:TRAP-type C4-dicarboxylate transport system permease small subunit
MVAIIVGLIFIAFSVFAVLPFGPLNWWVDVIDFLKGSVPVIALFVGLIAVFIGIADIKDRIEAKKEEEEEKKEAAEKKE